MIDGIDHYWIWIALGLLLAVLELLVPGVYLIWLAVAALVTGALAFVLPFGWPLEIVSFVSLSLIAVYSARRYLNDKPIVSSDPLLNQRGGRMVGETALVVQPIESRTDRLDRRGEDAGYRRNACRRLSLRAGALSLRCPSSLQSGHACDSGPCSGR